MRSAPEQAPRRRWHLPTGRCGRSPPPYVIQSSDFRSASLRRIQARNVGGGRMKRLLTTTIVSLAAALLPATALADNGNGAGGVTGTAFYANGSTSAQLERQPTCRAREPPQTRSTSSTTSAEHN